MGNQISNSYWEAELPPKSGRVCIENFIRSKYDIIVDCSAIFLLLLLSSHKFLHLNLEIFHFKINFINRCKSTRYVEKRWIPRNGNVKASPRARGEHNQVLDMRKRVNLAPPELPKQVNTTFLLICLIGLYSLEVFRCILFQCMLQVVSTASFIL